MSQKNRHERKQLEYSFPFLHWNSEDINFPPHWHDCFEVIYLRRGRVYASVDGSIHEANGGDLILINSGAIHGFFDQSPGTSIRGFQFDITFFDEGFIALRDTIFGNPVLTQKGMPEALCLRLQNLLEEIAGEYRRREIGWHLAIKSRMCEFMLTLLRERSAIAVDAKPQTVLPGTKRILSFVFQNFDNEELRLEDAAEALKLNKFYFTRLFKRRTGQSFHAYLTRTRVDFAKQYLIESKMSITDAAFSAGFGSLQTFNRVFKTYTGMTPRDYRRENSASLRVPSQFLVGKKSSAKSQ